MAAIIGFLIVLAPLVIVHEFGHFFFARLFKVRADVFSIGFGPKLWRRKIGETEYCVSAIPLGGYVKLFGEEPGLELTAEEKPRALQYQAPWKRFLIFFGGPLFNFLWAILVFMVILMVGEPQLKSVMGRVLPNSEAEIAGFRSHDEVVSINGKKIDRFHELMQTIQENPDHALSFQVMRPTHSTPLLLNVTPSSEEGFTIYGEIKTIGKIDGMTPNARALIVGISNPNSPAGAAGIKTGEVITQMDGIPLQDWEDFQMRYSRLSPQTKSTKLTFEKGKTISLTLPSKRTSPEQDLGLFSSELFVKEVSPSSPAQAAGIQPKDRIHSVSGQTITSFFGMRESIQTFSEKTGLVDLTWERDGKMMNSKILPTKTKERDPALKKKVQYTVGILPMLEFTEGSTIVEREWNPFLLLYKGTERMLDLTWKNIVSIGKMFKGDVSVGTLGGPILIGKIAGESLGRGLIAFLTTMAVLSVGLGILNVLPVPVLDGGHMLLLVIEVVRKKPLSIRQIEIAQQVGFSLILLLMVVVMKNDLSRLSLFQ